VKDFGAVGDGVTDDTNAVKAAIAAANPATAGVKATVVLFPYTPKGYVVNTIGLPNGVSLIGESMVLLQRSGVADGVWIQLNSNTSVQNLTLNSKGLSQTRIILCKEGAKNVLIRDCAISDGLNFSTIGIDTDPMVRYLTVDNCTFTDVYAPIFMNNGEEKIQITNNEMTGWGKYAICVIGRAEKDINGDDKYYAVNNINIENNIIRNSNPKSEERQPIRFQGIDKKLHQKVSIINNTVVGLDTAYSTGGNADLISLHRCTDFIVSGNRLYNGGEVGITVAQQSERGVVSNNICIASDSVAICIGSLESSYTRSISVTGNVLFNSCKNRAGVNKEERLKTGIQLSKADHITVTANVMGDNAAVRTQLHGVSMSFASEIDLCANTGTNLGGSLYYFDPRRPSSNVRSVATTKLA
jgi:hypothetical protein